MSIIISGEELNKLGKKYCILTTNCNIHNEYEYKEGLNVLDLEFNKLNSEEEINDLTYDKYGLYFCDINNIQHWPPCHYDNQIMYYIYDVIIPDDAKVIIGKNKSHIEFAWRIVKINKTNKMILSNKRKLWSDNYCCNIMVKNHYWALKYVENQTEDIIKNAIKNDSLSIQFVNNINHELCKVLVNENGNILNWLYYNYYNYHNYNVTKMNINIDKLHYQNDILELAKIAVKQNPYMIQFIFETFGDIIQINDKYEIYKLAIKENCNILKYISNIDNYNNDIELCKTLITVNGLSLKYIEKQTFELCHLAVKQNGNSLEFVKPELMTKELCHLAVQQNGDALEFVKPELITKEMCKLAFQQNGLSLRFVKNHELTTKELCHLAVQQNGDALEFVKPELMTKEMCKLAVQQNGLSLRFVIPELITDEIYKLAVQQNGLSLRHVKPELMTDEICKLAVQQNGLSLYRVKPELITDEICKLAVQQNGLCLYHVKLELMTGEICKLAVQQNGLSLRFVIPELMTDEICKLAVQQNCDALKFVNKN